MIDITVQEPKTVPTMVKSDFPDYGKMLFYRLLTYGPNQVQAMIDRRRTISEQLTLRDQKGSFRSSNESLLRLATRS